MSESPYAMQVGEVLYVPKDLPTPNGAALVRFERAVGLEVLRRGHPSREGFRLILILTRLPPEELAAGMNVPLETFMAWLRGKEPLPVDAWNYVAAKARIAELMPSSERVEVWLGGATPTAPPPPAPSRLTGGKLRR